MDLQKQTRPYLEYGVASGHLFKENYKNFIPSLHSLLLSFLHRIQNWLENCKGQGCNSYHNKLKKKYFSDIFLS